jgi:hypothetical protein
MNYSKELSQMVLKFVATGINSAKHCANISKVLSFKYGISVQLSKPSSE